MLSRERWELEKKKIIEQLGAFKNIAYVSEAILYLEVLSFQEHKPLDVYQACKMVLNALNNKIATQNKSQSFFSSSIYFIAYPGFSQQLNAVVSQSIENLSLASNELDSSHEMKESHLNLVF